MVGCFKLQEALHRRDDKHGVVGAEGDVVAWVHIDAADSAMHDNIHDVVRLDLAHCATDQRWLWLTCASVGAKATL